MTLYLPVKEHLSSDELGKYVSYGIYAVQTACLTLTKSAFIPDVSQNLRFVLRLCFAYTRHRLAPCHLKDAVINDIS